MNRKIVFAGGAQARALARAYRVCLLGGRGQTVAYIGPVAASREAGRSALAEAEVIVLETSEAGDALPDNALPAKVERVRFPRLEADFLWPYAGQPHPQNRGIFPIVGGPYPAEHGDSYLDGLAASGVAEDAAVAEYVALDIARATDVDRKLADRLAHLRKMDDATGFAMAEIVGSGFRTTELFTSRERPSLALLSALAGQLFRRLGQNAQAAEKLNFTGFAPTAQPLHPGVVRHFGLTYVKPRARYVFNDEGQFTFEEYCHRYLRFEWNEPLHRGIQLVRTNPGQAISELDRGLAWSPDSQTGKRALKRALAATGQGAAGEAPDAEETEGEQMPAAAAVDGNKGDPRPLTQSGAGYVEYNSAPDTAAVSGMSVAALAGGQDELIESLPEMLPSAHALAGGEDVAYTSMAELMPPPPLKPILPPEMPGEPVKKGFFARLFGG